MVFTDVIYQLPLKVRAVSNITPLMGSGSNYECPEIDIVYLRTIRYELT